MITFKRNGYFYTFYEDGNEYSMKQLAALLKRSQTTVSHNINEMSPEQFTTWCEAARWLNKKGYPSKSYALPLPDGSFTCTFEVKEKLGCSMAIATQRVKDCRAGLITVEELFKPIDRNKDTTGKVANPKTKKPNQFRKRNALAIS